MNTINAELAEARGFLELLTSGLLRLVRSGKDVSQSEITVCKREIAFLEKILARNRNTPPPVPDR